MSLNDKEVCAEIQYLPEELMVAIFKFLPLESLITCESVCKRWRTLAHDVTLWKNILIIYSGKPGQSDVSEKNLAIIKTHSANIHRLKLQYVYNYSQIDSIIERCPNLTCLELVMCRICKEFENKVKQWPNLQKLNLKNSLLMQSNEDLLVRYDQFQKLMYLSLADFGLSSINCDTLLNCKYLSHIFIEKIRGLSLVYIQRLIISKQDILETFHIYGGDAVNDNCFVLLSKCPRLKDLAIIRCENITDKGFFALAHLKKIIHLQIWNNINFTEHTILQTMSSPSLITLRSLSFSRISNISPRIVDVISEYYTNLKFLALYQCPRIINTDYEKQLKSKFRNIEVVLY